MNIFNKIFRPNRVYHKMMKESLPDTTYPQFFIISEEQWEDLLGTFNKFWNTYNNNSVTFSSYINRVGSYEDSFPMMFGYGIYITDKLKNEEINNRNYRRLKKNKIHIVDIREK